MLNLSDHVEDHLIHGINPVFHWSKSSSVKTYVALCKVSCNLSLVCTLYSIVLVTGQSTYDEFFFLTPESVTVMVSYHCGENIRSYSLKRTTTWFRILKWLFQKGRGQVLVSFNSSRIPSCEYQKLNNNSRGGNESGLPTTLNQAFISG